MSHVEAFRRPPPGAAATTAIGPLLAWILVWALACSGAHNATQGAVKRGRALTDRAQYEEAHEVLVQAASRAETMPAPSLDRAMAFYALGDLYLQYPPLAEPGDAGMWLARARDEYQAVLGPEHPAVAVVLAREAEAARDRGRAAEARGLSDRAMEIFRERLPADHPVRVYQATGTPIPIHPDEIARIRWTPGTERRDAYGKDPGPEAPTGAVTSSLPGEDVVAVEGTFLEPNVTGPDGAPGFLHVTPADMPWVVSIGLPKRPPKYGSLKEARQRAIDAMKMWETAIQPHLPWFRLAFVEDDPNAAVQVEWKRRLPGDIAGKGGMRWWGSGDGLRVGGQMQISTTPDNYTTLEIDELSVLVTHEFGHCLGLGHCLDCDSAMNYSWQTRERVFVSELDVSTFRALVAQPNAF